MSGSSSLGEAAQPVSSLVAAYTSELRASEGLPRSDIVALNAVLRKHGLPPTGFGAATVPVGSVQQGRVELLLVGLHRHFLSDVTSTIHGLESIILGGDDDDWEDMAERICYVGCATPAPSTRAALLCALGSSAQHQRPVRILRTIPESRGRRPECFRYDGLYAVQRRKPDAPDDAEPRYLLLRQPEQPALPAGIGGKPRRAKPAGEEASAKLDLSSTGEVIATAPTHAAPAWAAEALRVGAIGSISVYEALLQLHEAREALVSDLSPGELYTLAKRSTINQVRLRSAIQQLHAADEPSTRRLKLSESVARRARDQLSGRVWPKREAVKLNP